MIDGQNEENIFEIHVPAKLFYEMNVEKIKEIIDRELVNQEETVEKL